MLGQDLHNFNKLQDKLFTDWLNPIRSRGNSMARTSQNDKLNQTGMEGIGLPMLQRLINTNFQAQKEFLDHFMFGVQMQIWRKGRIKPVTIYVDHNRPNFIWISSKTKAFIFDLTYTAVTRCDYQLEKASKVKDYIVMNYFQEKIALLFRGERSGETQKYFELFHNYIIYNNMNQAYPPYFSRILKMYKMANVENSVSKESISDILRLSSSIGLKDRQQNWYVLQLIFSRSHDEPMKNRSLLSPLQVSDYFKIINCYNDLKTLFEHYAGYRFGNQLEYLQPVMSKEAFRLFLRNEQGEKEEFISQVLQQTKQYISFYDFCTYLENEKSNYVALGEEVNENLPLTDYFCFSSHNTYLSGNQLTSDAKIERYIEDLQLGVKCVEIDVHNDGSVPIITHAFQDTSLCKPIDFEQTIRQIGLFCDKHPSHYPIIISLQNHAKEENRYKMLDIFMRHMKSRLFMVHSQQQRPKICKTLHELKGKIILKSDSKIGEILAFKNKNKLDVPNIMPLPIYLIPCRFPLSHFQERYDYFQKFSKGLEYRKSIFQANIPKSFYLPLQQISKITGMFKSVQGINNENSTGYESTSLTNKIVQKQSPEKIVSYSKRSWLRVYPLGSEIASNNYNPVPSLKLGAQIIALNTQTKDDYAWLMKSYFTAGRPNLIDKIGYIEKPLHLRSNQPRILIMKEYNIKIMTLFQEVSIKFYGTQSDIKLNQYSSFTFSVKDYTEAFLMFRIGEKLKQCVPLRFIREGYRVLAAKNEMYLDSGERVLIHTTIQQYYLN